jgi:carotenoid cleavage dioxygenase
VNTLETVGVSPLNALLEKPNDQLSPMPRVHPNGERLTAYRIRRGVFGSDQLTFFDMEADGRISSVREHSLKGRANALHDLAITESHDVVVRWGRVALAPVAFGTSTVGDAIRLPPGDTIVHLLPRNSNEKRFAIRLPRQQIFHLFNAFRVADTLVLDVVAYDEPIDFSRVHVDRFMTGPETPPRIRRHTIDLSTRRVSTQNYEASGEAPDIDQRRHAQPSRFGYVAGVNEEGCSRVVRSAYFWSNAVVKIDFETSTVTRWQAPSGAFLSPPAFVPVGPGEDKGYVLTFMTLGNRSAVLVLDARDIAWGPIATAWFDTALPATSHTSWYAAQ